MSDYQPTCPYVVDVEVQAWGEGLTFALHEDDNLGRDESNPYTSGDTCVAWATGYDEGKYKPAVFDFAAISDLPKEIQHYISVQLHLEREPRKEGDDYYAQPVVKGVYLMWSWTGGTLYENDRPAWVANRPLDRAVRVNPYDITRMIRTGIGTNHITPPMSLELPCPPYEYEYSQGGMRISSGAYTKWGDKEDWKAVIDKMQEALDEAPDELDISELDLTVDVTATCTYTMSIPASTLLNGETTFDGDTDELDTALEDALGQLDTYELEYDGYGSLDVDTYTAEAQFSDLSNDIDLIS